MRNYCRRLVTCPVCRTDQHIYAQKIANHDNGVIRCAGSKTPVSAVRPPFRQPI